MKCPLWEPIFANAPTKPAGVKKMYSGLTVRAETYSNSRRWSCMAWSLCFSWMSWKMLKFSISTHEPVSFSSHAWGSRLMIQNYWNREPLSYASFKMTNDCDMCVHFFVWNWISDVCTWFSMWHTSSCWTRHWAIDLSPVLWSRFRCLDKFKEPLDMWTLLLRTIDVWVSFYLRKREYPAKTSSQPGHRHCPFTKRELEISVSDWTRLREISFRS